ncbi:MAG: hypothetical protein DMF68_18060 [Acidobacteria bacterium]|nr:MAG: hypothetical protein DMF68_18060 [Acidobacteriota bacterium]
MKRVLLLSLICLISFQLTNAKTKPTHSASTKVPQKTASLTGTYRTRWSEFKVQALGVNRIHVRFDGSYQYKVRGELTANTGTADGMVTLKDNAATFVPEGTTGCSINLKFVGNKLVVKQTGSDSDCGFGHNVTADGTYIKRSSRPPKFEER